MADEQWEKSLSFMVIKSITIELVPAAQEVYTIIGDAMGWRNSKSIEERCFDSGRRFVEWWLASVTETHAYAIPNVAGIVNTERCRCNSQEN